MTQEKAKYDSYVQAMKSHAEEVNRLLQEGLKLSATKREEGLAKMTEAISLSQSQWLKSIAERQGWKAAVDAAAKNLENMNKIQAKTMATPKTPVTGEQKAISAMGGAGVARHIYDVTGKAMNQKEAESVSNTVQAVNQITNLRERLKDPEIQTGLRAVPAPLLEKISSLVGKQTDEGSLRNFLEQNLTGIDKTTLFIKDAILASFKIEQGLTGSRVPVFTQKVVGPILDPRAYKPETYDALLKSRQTELEEMADSRGITADDLKKLIRKPGAAITSPALGNASVGTVANPIKLD
jgi:hypothetical protein